MIRFLIWERELRRRKRAENGEEPPFDWFALIFQILLLISLIFFLIDKFK